LITVKKIGYILLTLFISINSFAQNTNLTSFVGNWEWVNGNETFKLNFFIENEGISGNYKLVEINNGVEIIIYSSKFSIADTGNYTTGFSGYSDNGVLMGGRITDSSWKWNGENKTKTGSLAFTILPSINGQIRATWKVSKLSGLRVGDEILEFVIPTDIILNKVN